MRSNIHTSTDRSNYRCETLNQERKKVCCSTRSGERATKMMEFRSKLIDDEEHFLNQIKDILPTEIEIQTYLQIPWTASSSKSIQCLSMEDDSSIFHNESVHQMTATDSAESSWSDYEESCSFPSSPLHNPVPSMEFLTSRVFLPEKFLSNPHVDLRSSINLQQDPSEIYNRINEKYDLNSIFTSFSPATLKHGQGKRFSSSKFLKNIQEGRSIKQKQPIQSSCLALSRATPQLSEPKQKKQKLHAPCSFCPGYVNMYLVVDPVTRTVVVPRQTIFCNIGDSIKAMEYGPMFLPGFDTSAIAEYSNHVVTPYQSSS